MPKTWFSFQAAAQTNAVEISIYDDIGAWGVSAKGFIAELKRHAGKDIDLRINCRGGVVTEGYAIFNALKRHTGKVTVQIDALAASMATYVALAGSKIRMAENGFFMIHNVSGIAVGDAKAIRKYADLCEKMQGNIVDAYVARTGKTEAEIIEAMDQETWLSAEEAKEWNFIDEITDPIEAAACATFDLSSFRNAPPALLGFDNTPGALPNANQMDLKAALARIAELDGLLNTANGSVSTLTTDKTTLTNQLTEANGKVTKLEGEKTELSNQLTAAQGEVITLKGQVATLKKDTRTAEEIAAANGAQNVTTTTPAAAAGEQKDGKALYEQYAKLDGRKAAAFWDKHEKDLMAYADQCRKG